MIEIIDRKYMLQAVAIVTIIKYDPHNELL